MGRELEENWFCYPEKVDVYCRWMGRCSSDGGSCTCFSSMLSAEHRCSILSLFYDDDDTSAVNTAADVSSQAIKQYFSSRSIALEEEMDDATSCVAGDRAFCNQRGVCVSPEEGCACDDPAHFWPDDNCQEFHHGTFLEPGQCCMPGAVDYYCSWLGTCDATGTLCECFEPDHRLASERCANYYDDLSEAPEAIDDDDSTCPDLVEVSSQEASSSSNDDDDNFHKDYLTASYTLVPILAVAIVVAAVIVYRSRYISAQRRADKNADEGGFSMRCSASADTLRKSAVANPMADP